ncbi:hypothetical protein LCL95_13520 [Bacillus timonensis]|nr:hypothetical protein [Bacillus timonensis]
MIVVLSLQHSVEIELLLTDMEQMGIAKESLHITSLERVSATENKYTMQIVQNGEKYSFADLALSIGTVLAVFGVMYGYSLKLGPVLWGLIGFLCGAILSKLIMMVYKKRSIEDLKTDQTAELLLFVQCDESQIREIKSLVKNYPVLGLSTI